GGGGGGLIACWGRRGVDGAGGRRAGGLALAGAGAALASLASPEHVHALAFPFVIGTPDAAIWLTNTVEWTPPALFGHGRFDPPLLGYYLVAIVGATLAAIALAPRRLALPH